MPIWKGILLLIVVGVVGTGAGGLIVACMGSPSKRTLSFLLGLAGGIMVSVVAFDLMPEAFETGSTYLSLAGLLAGCGAAMCIDVFLPHVHHVSSDPFSSRLVRAAAVVAIGIAMHNIPEGLAVGAGLAAGTHIGLQVALMIFLHNMPEGIAVAAPLKAIGKGKAAVIGAACQAGTPTLAGGLIGMLVGGISPIVLSVCLSFAAGAMLFITFDELIPDSQELAVNHSGTLGAVTGVIINIVISKMLGG